MKILLIALTLIVPLSQPQAEVLQLDYEGFTVWLDCDKRSAVKFRYNAQRDTGNHKRKKSFYKDKAVPARCRQKSVKSYRRGKGEKPAMTVGI
jgi:endonuclease G, mitochondrial